MGSSISVVIHTYNNEAIIRDCLESVKDFDEIVICDMYSTDKTLEIAQEYGCKIVMHENIGWADPARNFAISQASNEWVLVVDSDEAIPDALRLWLYDFTESANGYSAVKIPRLNNFWGKFMEMQYPDYVTRFFKKSDIFWPPKVHSHPEIKRGDVFTIPKENKNLAMLHYTSEYVRDFVNIINKYTDFEVEKMEAKGKKVNIPFAFFQSIWLIFEKFIFKKGYKDGTHGFVLCCCWGAYKFLAHVKYWEYKKNLKERK